MDQSKATNTSGYPRLTISEDRTASNVESRINPQDSHSENVATVFVKCEVTESEGESTTGTQFGDHALEYVKNEGGTSLSDEITSFEGFKIDSYSCDTSIAALAKVKVEVGKDDESLTNQIHTTFDIKTESISQSEDEEYAGEEREHDSTKDFRDPCDRKLSLPVKRETIDDKHEDHNQRQRDPRHQTEPHYNGEGEDLSQTPFIEGSVPKKGRTKIVKKSFNYNLRSSSHVDNRDFTEHLRTHTGEKPYSFSLCSALFSEKNDGRLHPLRNHIGEKTFRCSVCTSSFTRKYCLKVHMRTHTGEKPFSCDQCTSSFTQKRNLNLHMQTHTGITRFSCDQFTSSFAQKSNLNLHRQTHTGKKRFRCSQCASSFARKGDLNVHMRRHTGEKPFSCSHCALSCVVKCQLILHMRTHTGEKPYSCSHCASCFARKGDLNIHMRTHTGEKPFKCSYCSSSFSRKHNLKYHIRTHSV